MRQHESKSKGVAHSPRRSPRRVFLASLISGVAFVLLSSSATEAASSGLVAAFSFNEGSGSSVGDSSGSGNNGTVSGATWSTAGKYGGALSFNGSSSLVSGPDGASLHLTTGMTLEAWGKPTAKNRAGRGPVYKGDGEQQRLARRDLQGQRQLLPRGNIPEQRVAGRGWHVRRCGGGRRRVAGVACEYVVVSGGDVRRVDAAAVCERDAGRESGADGG